MTDRLGVVLAVSLVAWIVVSWAVEGGSVGPMLAMLGLAAGGYLAGRQVIARPWISALVAVAVTVGVGIAVLLSPDALTRDPLAGPLGYANANAALYVQAAVLSGIAAARARRTSPRLALTLLTLALCALPYVVGSATGVATGVVVGLATVTAAIRPSSALTRVVLAVGATVLVALVAATAWAGERSEGDVSSPDWLVAALSERRLALWSDAVTLTTGSPLTGVGPGRFSVDSPTARADPDTREAHSVVLSQAAETGLPGAAVLLSLGVWVLLAMGRAARTDPPAAMVAAAGWICLGLHASVDYVAHYPWVVGLAALAAGAGTSGRGLRSAP